MDYKFFGMCVRQEISIKSCYKHIDELSKFQQLANGQSVISLLIKSYNEQHCNIPEFKIIVTILLGIVLIYYQFAFLVGIADVNIVLLMMLFF